MKTAVTRVTGPRPIAPIDPKRWENGQREIVMADLNYELDALEDQGSRLWDQYKRVGQLLVAVRGALPHGKFGEFLRTIERPGVGFSTLRRCIYAVENDGKVQRLRQLTDGVSKVMLLGELTDDEIDELTKGRKVGDIDPDQVNIMPRRELVAKVRKLTNKVKKGEEQIHGLEDQVEQLEAEQRGDGQPLPPIFKEFNALIVQLNKFVTLSDSYTDPALRKECASGGMDGDKVWQNTVAAFRQAVDNVMPKLRRLGVVAYESKPGTGRGKPSTY